MTIHIAGVTVRVGNRTRQRCAWCDFVLHDVDLANVAVHPPPEPEEELDYPGFEPLALVRVDGGLSSVVPHEDGKPLPAGWCGDEGKPPLRLVPKDAG